MKRTDAAGNSATNEYDADGRMVKAVNEEGAVTSYTYDSDSRLISMTDALGHVTAFEYDAMDRVTKVTDALNNATTYTYDAAGNITSATDAKGVTTTYTYDANGNLLTVTDAAGTVTYAYDALNQAVSVTDRNGNTQSFTYDAAGRITKVTDKNGNETAYTYDGNGNIVKTTDALGTDVLFEYNANDQLIKMTQNRVDSFHEQSETMVTLYEYDGRNLVTKVVRSDNNQELYTYDGNGNMISKTDGDGYVTEYTYNSLDLVSHINYNDAKEVTYQYNKVGELVKMDDWLGTTTFEVDLLGQLKKVTDHKGKVVSYAYDAVGNQTAVTYPDETTVTKTYDAVYNLTKVTDAESQNYTYVYDDAGRVTKLTYPNGWVEDYTYDAEGNLLKTVDTDPFHGNKQSKKYEYRYDAEGNLVSEYKRDTTASNRALTTTYTYDGLNRVISAHEEAVGHNTTRTYLYDTLGNLIREEQDGCVEYKYNGFALDESKKCGTIPNSIGTSYWEYTYDGRGNLVSNDKYTRTTSGMAWQNEETYVYDETNHMVDAKNEQGEHSLYTYNGLGLRVGRELIMQDNTHGYTDFHDETPSVETGIDKPEVAVESYVIDYTSPTFRTLVMEEEGGFDYRWVYGLDKLSVKITSEGTNWWGQNVKQDILKDYLHQDRLGSTTNLSDKFGRVVGRADYNEWGEITYKDALDITSAYRRIYPQLNYTGHDWDDVLEMYYAKARFYDPDAKRFVEIDPVKGSVTDPLSLVSYLYCVDNPLRWVDLLGLRYVPLRDLAEKYGGTVEWLPETAGHGAKAKVKKGNKVKYYTATDEDNDRAYFSESDGKMYVDDKYFLKQWNIEESFGFFVTYNDRNEFRGKNKETYLILQDIQKRWDNEVDDKSFEYYQQLACDVRERAREGTPFKYGQVEIQEMLHANADEVIQKIKQMRKSAQNNSFMNAQIYGIFYNFVRHTETDWDYKWNPEWQVPYDTMFDVSEKDRAYHSMDEYKLVPREVYSYYGENRIEYDKVSINRRNWTPWIYFEGRIISADKLGNINLAYVAARAGFPEHWYSNFATRDKDDAEYIDFGIELARSGW